MYLAPALGLTGPQTVCRCQGGGWRGSSRDPGVCPSPDQVRGAQSHLALRTGCSKLGSTTRSTRSWKRLFLRGGGAKTENPTDAFQKRLPPEAVEAHTVCAHWGLESWRTGSPRRREATAPTWVSSVIAQETRAANATGCRRRGAVAFSLSRPPVPTGSHAGVVPTMARSPPRCGPPAVPRRSPPLSTRRPPQHASIRFLGV